MVSSPPSVGARSVLVLVVLLSRRFRLPFPLVRVRRWFLVVLRVRRCRLSELWGAPGVGSGPSRLAKVLVVLSARRLRIIGSFVRRHVLVDPVEISPESAKFAS